VAILAGVARRPTVKPRRTGSRQLRAAGPRRGDHADRDPWRCGQLGTL